MTVRFGRGAAFSVGGVNGWPIRPTSCPAQADGWVGGGLSAIRILVVRHHLAIQMNSTVHQLIPTMEPRLGRSGGLNRTGRFTISEFSCTRLSKIGAEDY